MSNIGYTHHEYQRPGRVGYFLPVYRLIKLIRTLMPCNNRHRGGKLPVCHGNTSICWNRNSRSNARNDLVSYPVLAKHLGFFPNTAKNRRVTTLKTDHILAG
ncbi:hypothetical protein D3C81_1396320 [compost metagenome]